MTRVVVHINRIVVDPAVAAGRSRAELTAALGAALTEGLADRFAGDAAWARRSVPRLAVSARDTDPATLAAAVAQAVGGLAASSDGSGRSRGERR